MRKRYILLIALVLLFTLTACGSENENEAISDNNEIIAGSQQSEQQKLETSDSSSDNGNGSGGIKTLVDSTDLQLSPYLVCARNSENDLFGYIDIRTGEYVIEPQFKYCDEDFGDDGWAIVTYERISHVINTDGEFLFAHEDIGGAREYEGDCIVVYTQDKQKAFLYHGADFVCELEIPAEDYIEVSPTITYWSNNYKSQSYTPERYILLDVKLDAGRQYVWYDSDGKVIFVTENIGGLAGDESGYYYIRKNFVDVIDFDGNIVETIERDDEDYCGVVEWDGDNWYTIISLNGETGIYTNGLVQLCETVGQVGHSRDYYDNIDADCGVIRLLDGSCIKTDGTLFFEGLSYRMGSYSGAFRNGYAKAISNGITAYMDTEGNPVLDIPKDSWKQYSDVLQDGYIVYGKDGLWGIMKMDGSIVAEPKYQNLYTME